MDSQVNTRAKETRVSTQGNATVSQPNGETFYHIQESQVHLPYPPPSILEKYNSINPGLGDKVVALIDKEGAHRHECERKALDANIQLRKDAGDNERLEIYSRLLPRLLGQVFAFLLCLGFGIAGVWLAYLGKEISGSIIGTGGLIGLAYVFINGHKEKSQSPQVKPKQRSAKSR